VRLRRPGIKARIRPASCGHSRPPGYFNEALTAEDIEQGNRIADAVAQMNARRLS
jgi:hypothetical protein